MVADDIGRQYARAGDDVKEVVKLCAPGLYEALESLAKMAEEAKADAPRCSGGHGRRCGPPAARIDRPDGPVACVYHASGRRIFPLRTEESS